MLPAGNLAAYRYDIVSAAGICLLLLLTASASAQSVGWTGADGNQSWSDPANWNPQGIPAAGNEVTIPATASGPISVNYDYAGPAVTLDLLTVGGSDVSSTIPSVLNIPANNLVSDAEDVDANGTINQSGGTNTVVQGILINSGSYIQSGGSVTGGNITVGNDDDAALGDESSNYTLSGGSVNADHFNVSVGTMNITSGTITASTFGMNSLPYFPTQATINISGGSVNATTGIPFQGGGMNTQALNITGGAITAAEIGDLSLDGNLEPNITISGGSLNVSGQIGGPTSSINLTISGGTVSAGNLVKCTLSLGSHGLLTLTGTAGLRLISSMSDEITDQQTFGQVVCAGAVNAPTALNLDFDPSYVPQLGDTFPIILGQSGAPVIGTIQSLTQSESFDNGYFTLEYDPSDNPYGIDVEFVPEPASAALFAPLAIALLARRKRAVRPTH